MRSYRSTGFRHAQDEKGRGKRGKLRSLGVLLALILLLLFVLLLRQAITSEQVGRMLRALGDPGGTAPAERGAPELREQGQELLRTRQLPEANRAAGLAFLRGVSGEQLGMEPEVWQQWWARQPGSR
ncbi:MAG: hypothetical protein FJ125_12995 [Deltaproteobacteria bacterium]|nr:hypothetical protein [Deltaproteobacteria bacterium]